MAKKLFNELETVNNHSISDFLLDEEASIPKGQLLAVGSLMVVLACTLGVEDALAWHSNFGHGSHQNWNHGSHNNWHGSHASHSSHSSHSSHGSHNNLFKW